MAGYLTQRMIDRPEYIPCEICKMQIHDSCPSMEIGDYEICTDCMVSLIQSYAKMPGMGGAQPFILKAIIDESFDRRKRIPIPKKVRDYIFSIFKNACTICGSTEKLEIDHIHPYSKGGTNSPSNLQVLCKDCNIKKSNHNG